MVVDAGLEPATFSVSARCSNQTELIDNFKELWLSRQDSNLDSDGQNVVCCHYTTGQCSLHGWRDSNSHRRFWRPACYHCTTPVYILWTQWESNPNDLLARESTCRRHLAHIVGNTGLEPVSSVRSARCALRCANSQNHRFILDY